MNTEMRKKFRSFFKLLNDSVFWQITENIRKHRDIKFLKTETRSYLVSEQAIQVFSPHLLGIEMERTQITMNKPV